MKYVNINEIFGATIQGEGPHAGERVGFVRFAGCNLSCSWCDTPYSWDWSRYDRNEEVHKCSIMDIVVAVNPMRVKRLVITGGEPMLQQQHFPEIHRLTECLLDVETNGTRMPTPEAIEAVDMFVVSPKLTFAGDSEKMRIKPDVIKKFAELSLQGKAIFKFVAEKEEDFDEIEKFQQIGNIPNHAIWIMPEGMTAETHLPNLRKLANAVVDKEWNLTSRLHVLIWEQLRGH